MSGMEEICEPVRRTRWKRGLCMHCNAKTPPGWSACTWCYENVQTQFIDLPCGASTRKECPHTVKA